MASTATVQVHTTDTTWTAKHGAGTTEERVNVPGCTITGTYRFCGREWVNYRLPAGTPLPKDWDKGTQNMLAAPAVWVTSN